MFSHPCFLPLVLSLLLFTCQTSSLLLFISEDQVGDFDDEESDLLESDFDDDEPKSKTSSKSTSSAGKVKDRKVPDARDKERVKLRKQRRNALLRKIQAGEDDVAPRPLVDLAEFSTMTLGPAGIRINGVHSVISKIPSDGNNESFGFVFSRKQAIMEIKESFEWSSRGVPAFDKSSQGDNQDGPQACLTPSVVVAHCKEDECSALVHWIVRIVENGDDVSLISYYLFISTVLLSSSLTIIPLIPSPTHVSIYFCN